jgi:hypothetical protein
MCNQGECMWLHLDLIGEVLQHCTEVFPSVDYAFTTIPTYPSGQIGFLMCSTSPGAILREPVRTPTTALAAQLKYYTPAVHAAAFVLPAFAEKVVAGVRVPPLPSVCQSVSRGAVGTTDRRSLALGLALGAAAAAAVALMRR